MGHTSKVPFSGKSLCPIEFYLTWNCIANDFCDYKEESLEHALFHYDVARVYSLSHTWDCSIIVSRMKGSVSGG